MMAEGRTIGQLAREVGLPTSTIRYYEREGLIAAPARSGGNYRLYDGSAGERLRFIRAAQATGFTLSDIRTLLRYRDGHLAPCAEVRELIETRLQEVHQRLTELRHVQGVLESFLQLCREGEGSDPCRVMDTLDLAEPTA